MIQTLGQVAREATELLGVFKTGPSTLVKTGIGPLDAAIGGLVPGENGVMGLMRGLGKSSTALSAALTTPNKTGIISVEDGKATIGSRALSWKTGIDSLAMRKKELRPADLDALSMAVDNLGKLDDVVVAVIPGAGLDKVLRTCEEMADAGCEIVWFDYLQRMRDRGASDRRNEIASAAAQFTGRCAELGLANIMLSQFSRATIQEGRMYRPMTVYDRPQLNHLKEAGEIENEARFAVLGWKDRSDAALLNFVLEKSVAGGEGTIWSMRRDASGSLRPVEEQDEWT